MQNHGKRGVRPRGTTRGVRIGNRAPPPMQHNPNPRETLPGVYANERFTNVGALLTGCEVQVQVKSKKIYKGILCTISPHAETVLEVAHMVDQNGENAGTAPDIQKIEFKASNVVSITAKQVDLEYGVKDSGDSFVTDAEIARRQNGQAGERELEEWHGAPVQGEDLSLESSGSDQHANGWSAEEMFKTNEKRYGVTSSYDESLLEYTTGLDQSNPKVYQERKEKAEQLAKEIESGYSASARADSDDITEEDKFSGVSRGSDSTGNRYIPPHMRDGSRGHSPQHASTQRRPQVPLPRLPGQGRPQMTSPHHGQPAPHPSTQAQSHPHAQAHPSHQPMGGQHQQQQQQMPGHGYPNVQARLGQPGPQQPLPQQQQLPQQSQQALPPHQLQATSHQSQPLQQQQQQPPVPQPQQKHYNPVPQQPPPHVHGGPRQHLVQTPPRPGQLPPTQTSPRPPGFGSQSPRASPLSITETTSTSIREEKPQPSPSEERPSSTEDSSNSSRKTEPSTVERTTSDSTTVSPEKTHKNVQDKALADLKEFSNTFNLEGKTTDEDAPSIPSTQAPAATDAKPATTDKTTPTVPSVTEDREPAKEAEPSSGKSSPSQPSKEKEKQLNPLAKPFIPGSATQRTMPTKTPTPPRPQSISPSPIILQQHPNQFAQAPYILSGAQAYPGAFSMSQQTAMAQAQASHMGSKMLPKKGFQFASSTNMPRPQPPTDLPTHVIPPSVAAGQPLVSPMSFQHHPGQMIPYQTQQGIPGPLAGQQMIPQAGPYPMYPTKQHAVPFRQMPPQPSIQGVPQPQPAHLHALPDANLQGNSSVLVAGTQLQAQAGQVQQQMHAQYQHQQVQQQQQQQQQQQAQQQQHASQQPTQQSQQQQQQPQHHHHPQPQPVVHLQQQQQQQQQQHQHPHSQPHTTPPQQQSHGSQPSPMAQATQQQQQQQQQHRPTPSPVHHMPLPQHPPHQLPHASQAHHLQPQHQQLVYPAPSSMQQGPPSMAVQSSQFQQFGGQHQYMPQYITTAAAPPATNITNVTRMHPEPHPHPTQANVTLVPQPGQTINHMVPNPGPFSAHILAQTQAMGQAHGQVQAYQHGN